MTQHFGKLRSEVIHLLSKVLVLEFSQCFRMVSSGIGLSDLLISNLTDVGNPCVVNFISLDFRLAKALICSILTIACFLRFFVCDATGFSKLILKVRLLNFQCVKTLSSFFFFSYSQVLPILAADMLHGGLVSSISDLSDKWTCVGLEVKVVLLLILV